MSGETLSAEAEVLNAQGVSSTGALAEWARQSCQIVGKPGFYSGHKIGSDYAEQWMPVVQLRLPEAVMRLATMRSSVQ